MREVRDLRPGDWPEVARIYAEGIQTGNATFETEIPSWQAWDAAHLDEHRFVAERGGRVVGWVALAVELQRDWAREETVDDVIEIVLTERLLRP